MGGASANRTFQEAITISLNAQGILLVARSEEASRSVVVVRVYPSTTNPSAATNAPPQRTYTLAAGAGRVSRLPPASYQSFRLAASQLLLLLVRLSLSSSPPSSCQTCTVRSYPRHLTRAPSALCVLSRSQPSLLHCTRTHIDTPRLPPPPPPPLPERHTIPPPLVSPVFCLYDDHRHWPPVRLVRPHIDNR